MATQDKIQREILPIPDIPQVGLTTYDGRDPDTKYPLIVSDKPFLIFFLFRSYMEPVTNVSPDDNELLYNQAIYFGPYFIP